MQIMTSINFTGVMIEASDCLYTPCYCEENIYKFIEDYSDEFFELYAVFISNPHQRCVIWHQRLREEPAINPVCWDYHVIAIGKKNSQSLVFDFDTTLPFPCPLQEYVSKCFRPSDPEISQWWLQFAELNGHFFRPIIGLDFLSSFSSDRSHMIDDNGDWKSDPPKYDPIFKPDKGNNLMEFLDFNNSTLPGRWLHYEGFLSFFNINVHC